MAYIIGAIGNKEAGAWSIAWSIAKNPVKHNSLSEAKFEAERLAKANPQTKFVVLEIKGAVEAVGVRWE